jgi:hypothetical protein
MNEILIQQNVYELMSEKQLKAIEQGRIQNQRMKLLINKATQSTIDRKYKDYYIYSPPGLGKTFTVQEYLSISNIQCYPISGNISMFAFGLSLAVIAYSNQTSNKIVIHVDDCEVLFENINNVNVMKKVLDSDRVFVYEKSLQSQMSNLNDLQRDAIEFYSKQGKMGFKISTENMTFIFTSNKRLPYDTEVEEARNKGKAKSTYLSHLSAIRSRIHVADFELTKNEFWGWISAIVIDSNCLEGYNATSKEICEVLDFLYHYWEYFKEKNIRTVEKMFTVMRDYPEAYEKIWQMDYIKFISNDK